MNLAADLDVLIPPEALEERCRQLGAQITRDLEGRDVVLVAILKGSYMFLADLARHIDLPIAVDFLGLTSYGAGTETTGVVRITSDLSKPVAGKDLLIVEDIVDTGLTMKFLLDNLQTRRPSSVRICSLLHKPSRARVRIPLDYVGFVIEDKFVVGYGLDYSERYRNVPFVGVLRQQSLAGTRDSESLPK